MKTRGILLGLAMPAIALAGSWLVKMVALGAAPPPGSGFDDYYARGLAEPIPVVQFASGWQVLLAVWLTMAAITVCGYFFARNIRARRGGGPNAIIAAYAATGIALTFFSILQAFDVYYYVAYGRLYGVFGVNPYALGAPLGLPDATLQELFRPLHDPPFADPYGPGFTLIAGLLARLESSLALWTQLWSWRAAGVLSAVATAFALVRLMRRLPPPEIARRLALFMFNPIVLYESAVGAHNDMLMVAPAVWAFALVDELPLVAGLLLGASIAMKYVAAVTLPFLIIRIARANRAGAMISGLLAVGIPMLCARPFAFGATAAKSVAAIGSSLLMSLNWLLALPLLHSGHAASPAATWLPALPYLGVITWPRAIQLALLAACAIVFVVSVARYARRPSTGGIARPIAALIWVMPALHPWYLCWIAPFAVAGGAWGVYAAWFAALGLLGYAHEGVVPSPANDALFVAAAIAMLTVPVVMARRLRPPAVEGLRPGCDVPIE